MWHQVRIAKSVSYLLCGAWNTAFGLGLFAVINLVLAPGWPIEIQVLISSVLATIQAHAAQRRFTWKSKNPYSAELWRFASAQSVVFVANTVAISIATRAFGLNGTLAQCIISPTLVLLQYPVQARWIYRGRNE